MKRPTLAVAIVARGHAPDGMRLALETTYPIADEVHVLLDTRKGDQARRVCEEYAGRLGAPVLIHDDPFEMWMDDCIHFAAARRKVESYCTADWILAMDEGKRFMPGNLLERLVEADAQGCDAMTFDTRLTGKGVPDESGGRYAYIYRRGGPVKWLFPIHNQLHGAKTVMHTTAEAVYSYEGKIEARAARGLPALRKLWNEGDPHGWSTRAEEKVHAAHFLSRMHRSIGQMDAAVEWAEVVTELEPSHPGYSEAWVRLSQTVIAQKGLTGGMNEALGHCLRGLRANSNNLDLWHELARLALGGWFELGVNIPPESRIWTYSGHFLDHFETAARLLGLPLAMYGEPLVPFCKERCVGELGPIDHNG